MKLHPHQQKLLDLNPHKWGVFFSTGGGKTLVALSLCEKNCKTALIIVPKALVRMWEREVSKIENRKCQYTIISKETFRRDVKDIPQYDGVVVDESHHFFSEKSQLSKSLFWYNKKNNTEFLWLCTATPVLASPMSVYTLGRHLGKDFNYMSFRRMFFDEVRMGHRFVPKAKKGMDKELSEIVKSLGTVVDLEDIVDVPTQTFETEYFDITDEQKKGIGELEDTEFISRWTHKSCIENGFLYSDGYSETKTFKCLKNDRIVELVKSSDKIAIICRYNHQIHFLKAILSQYNKPIFIINGESTGYDRDSIVLASEKSPQAIVLIQSATCEGYELPSIGLIVFMSLDFKYLSYAQCIGRFLRVNALKENRYIHLITNGVDKDVYDCIMRKDDFYIELFNRN